MNNLENIIDNEYVRFSATKTEIADFIRKNHKNMTYSSFFDRSNIVFFCYNQDEIEEQKMTKEIPLIIEQAQITHLACDMIPTSMQSEINDFYKELIDTKKLTQNIQQLEYSTQKTAGLIKIIIKCKKEGIKFLAIKNKDGFKKIYSQLERFNQENKSSAQKIINWIDPQIKTKTFFEKLFSKNTDLISETSYKSKKYKIAICSQSITAGYYPTNNRLNNHLNSAGYNSIVVKLCCQNNQKTKNFNKMFNSDLLISFSDRLKLASESQDLEFEKFTLPIYTGIGSTRDADYYIHLP